MGELVGRGAPVQSSSSGSSCSLGWNYEDGGRDGTSCFSFHDFAAAANGFGMRHPRRLLKPPISDIWSKGGRWRAFAAQRENHGSRGDGGGGDRRRWSGSKCDGLIKDDHNWGGLRGMDGRNKSRTVRPSVGYARSVSPSFQLCSLSISLVPGNC